MTRARSIVVTIEIWAGVTLIAWAAAQVHPALAAAFVGAVLAAGGAAEYWRRRPPTGGG